jgi:hypothetical protein
MTKIFCDRCGVEIVDFEQADVSITTYDGDGERDCSTEYELCPTCVAKLYEVVEAVK